MFSKLNPGDLDKPTTELKAGPAPMLDWLDPAKFVVDPCYQREVGKKGRANIRRIAQAFCWSKFAPVIVSPVEGGLFAIVDGQHRTTAAILCGIDKVPCQIVRADQAEQAAAYAAINGNVTYTTPTQIFYAKLAAEDHDALRIKRICDAAEVVVIRRASLGMGTKVKKGHTQAVAALGHCLHQYGEITLITSLQCITQTADGNAGYVRAHIMEAICQTLHDAQYWRDSGEQLFRALDDFSFPDSFDRATEDARNDFSKTFKKVFADLFRAHLLEKLGAPDRGRVTSSRTNPNFAVTP